MWLAKILSNAFEFVTHSNALLRVLASHIVKVIKKLVIQLLSDSPNHSCYLRLQNEMLAILAYRTG